MPPRSPVPPPRSAAPLSPYATRSSGPVRRIGMPRSGVPSRIDSSAVIPWLVTCAPRPGGIDEGLRPGTVAGRARSFSGGSVPAAVRCPLPSRYGSLGRVPPSLGMLDALRGNTCSRSSSCPCAVGIGPSSVAGRSAPVPITALPAATPVPISSSSASSGSASSARTSSGTGTSATLSSPSSGLDPTSPRASSRSSAERSRSARSCPITTRAAPVSNATGSSASMSRPSDASASSAGASPSPAGRADSGRSCRSASRNARSGSALSCVRFKEAPPFSRFSARRQRVLRSSRAVHRYAERDHLRRDPRLPHRHRHKDRRDRQRHRRLARQEELNRSGSRVRPLVAPPPYERASKPPPQNRDTTSSFAPSKAGNCRHTPETQRIAARRCPMKNPTELNTCPQTPSDGSARHVIPPLR